MKFKKYLSLTILTMSVIFTTGCYNQPSSTINFTPTSPTLKSQIINQKAILNVIINDLRSSAEIAKYTKETNIIKLSANPAVDILFNQIIKEDLNAKGFQITNNPTLANINIIANITDFYANIGQGNLRHNIKSKIQLEIKAQSSKGEFTKQFMSTNTKEGILTANNEDIQKILSQTLLDITQSINNDQSISNAINKYTN
ncbi:putative lipoprotein [Bisgaardia hudsonensis]|uniref:Putative lipoprotein n=1 Tax=Bisgaardia hudsonensis TaxID=109472 RepID=A0A4R2MU41_9PAST|nr:YajG family lipoprotein [Bisgaardia hudsonensis]QLB13724.1 hypothetical protein A6A11_08925 [Bisgaardia hudsonensis]TCP12062.1 putative lipoprotein [Bisgaardia hudsonensis]